MVGELTREKIYHKIVIDVHIATQREENFFSTFLIFKAPKSTQNILNVKYNQNVLFFFVVQLHYNSISVVHYTGGPPSQWGSPTVSDI